MMVNGIIVNLMDMVRTIIQMEGIFKVLLLMVFLMDMVDLSILMEIIMKEKLN